ncbi:helix-turn-helix domain-containing protein [Lachnospiraceae bacterium SGI.085]
MKNRDIKDIFVENLSLYMLKTGKKASELAHYLNVSKSTISMWASKKNLPRMELLDNIANFFDITVSELLHDNLFKINKEGSNKGVPVGNDIYFTTREFTPEELGEIRRFANFIRKQRVNLDDTKEIRNDSTPKDL